MSAAVFNEESFLKKLSSVTPTQDSIQSLALWVIHHKLNHEAICKLWLKKLADSSISPKTRLALFYLANDVIQTCKRKNARIFQDTFKRPLGAAVALVDNDSLRKSVARIIDVWAERNVYDKEFTARLKQALQSAPAASLNLTKSPAAEPSPARSPPPDQRRSDLEYQKIIEEFEPKRLCESIARFHAVQKETAASRAGVEASRLLDINGEHIRQYRDKSQCANFKAEFENSCLKLEDFLAKLSKEAAERQKLVQLMAQGEIFYDAQFKDATTVATAYRNYGAKVHTVRRKLEEVLAADSDAKLDSMDMEMSDDEPAAGKQAAGEPASAEKHARRYYSQLNLDPRQNRARQQAEKAKQPRGAYPDAEDLRLTNTGNSPSTPVRDENSPSLSSGDQPATGHNPLDFLTKFINKSAPAADSQEPKNSANLSYLVSSLKKFVGTGPAPSSAQPAPLMSAKFFDPGSSFQASFMDHSEAKPHRSATPTKDEVYQPPLPPSASPHFQQAPPAPPPLQFHPMFQMQQAPPLGLMAMMPPIQIEPGAHFHPPFGLYNQPPPQISPLGSAFQQQQHVSPDKSYWMTGSSSGNDYTSPSEPKGELADPGAPMLADRHYEDGSFQKRNKFADDGHSRRGRGGFNGYAKNAPYQQYQQGSSGGGGAKSFANNRRIPTINSQRGDGSQGGYSERGRGRYNSNNNNNGRF